MAKRVLLEDSNPSGDSQSSDSQSPPSSSSSQSSPSDDNTRNTPSSPQQQSPPSNNNSNNNGNNDGNNNNSGSNWNNGNNNNNGNNSGNNWNNGNNSGNNWNNGNNNNNGNNSGNNNNNSNNNNSNSNNGNNNNHNNNSNNGNGNSNGNGNNNGNGGNNNNNNNNGNNNNSNNNRNNNNNNNNNKGNSQTPPPPPPPPPPSPSNWNHRAPPPPPYRPPPPPLSSSSSSDESSSSSNSSNTKIIIGGAVAGGLLLIIMIVVVVSCARKRKRKPHNHMQYYRDNSTGNRSSDYYNSGQQGNWYNKAQPSTDHVVKINSPANVSAEQGWAAMPPPPPPPMMSSSELSSANFSGPYQPPLPPPHPAMALGFNNSSFTYDDLVAATGGFSKTNLLGQGGFGYVHKGVLPNGKEIAVKSLKSGSGQGEKEFQAEVDIISRVHHRHLVSLVGYCIAGEQRMLVYEYVPNNTLEFHLHGKDRPIMDWPTRMKIALGSAKGFAYLHEDCHPRIIHRDIKASNILIEDNFEAKVADFGLAKLNSDNFTHVSTRIMGTFGYLAPEYASSGKLTDKSDVYSYGVMLLELITGRKPVDISEDDSLVDWARPILMRAAEGGDYAELVDPRLGDSYDPDEMLRMVACAAACIRHSARRRPRMSQIVRALEGDVSLDALNEGVLKSGQNSTASTYDGNGYGVDMKKFRTVVSSTSQEFSSGEQGMGEFDIHRSPLSGRDSHEVGRRHSP